MGLIRPDGIAERFHKTVLNEFYRIAFRKLAKPKCHKRHSGMHS
jgi:hypothetical protein